MCVANEDADLTGVFGSCGSLRLFFIKYLFLAKQRLFQRHHTGEPANPHMESLSRRTVLFVFSTVTNFDLAFQESSYIAYIKLPRADEPALQ